MPLTLLKPSALLNGRAPIIRAAITWPIPGTVVISFSVAVLMSILPSGVFSFGCDVLGLGVPLGAIDAPGFGVEKRIVGEAVGAAGARCLSAGTKKSRGDRFAGRTFNRPMLMPQAPIFSCLAAFSNC